MNKQNQDSIFVIEFPVTYAASTLRGGIHLMIDPSSFAKVFIVFAWSSEVVWNCIFLVLRRYMHNWNLGITFFTGKWIFKGGVPNHFEHVRTLLGSVYVSWSDFLCWALGLHSTKMSTTPPINNCDTVRRVRLHHRPWTSNTNLKPQPRASTTMLALEPPPWPLTSSRLDLDLELNLDPRPRKYGGWGSRST